MVSQSKTASQTQRWHHQPRSFGLIVPKEDMAKMKDSPAMGSVRFIKALILHSLTYPDCTKNPKKRATRYEASKSFFIKSPFITHICEVYDLDETKTRQRLLEYLDKPDKTELDRMMRNL